MYLLTSEVIFGYTSVRSLIVSASCSVEHLRRVSDSAFVLRFSVDPGIPFTPGQYVSVGPSGGIHMREYSIYSPPGGSALEILVKEVEGGYVTTRLARLRSGAPLSVDGPFGFFTLDEQWREQRHVFIATGTGISPFHCFVGACDGLEYRLLHGIRRVDECYEYEWYDRSRITTCVSRGGGGDFSGRVTDYLRQEAAEGRLDREARYYLCGNCDMIYEAFDILQEHGVPHSHLFAEVYY